MALAPVLLDDLTWTEMVDSVRRRIPGASDGAWTLHAAVDPGITLLELFAWLIEQRVFWIDQISDDVTRALFALVGERPCGARPAATVLACRAPQSAPFLELPADVPFTFASVDAARTFTTRTATVLAPIVRIGVETPDGDRTADLRARTPVPLMATGGAASEFSIVLWLEHAGPLPTTTASLSLLLQLDTFGRLDPEWMPGAPRDVAPPARLTWSYSTGPATWRDLDAASVEDGTGGLRRPGIVRVPLPADWAPRGPATDGVAPYVLRVRTDAATYTVQPRLLGVAWNVVLARHWKAIDLPASAFVDQARQWLKLPGQRLVLPVDEPLPIADTVRVQLRERDGTETWTPADDFAFADRTSRIFTVDRTARTIRFGNGVTGRIPVPDDPDAPEITVTYRAGGGVEGTLAPGKPWTAEHAGFTIEATNPVAAVGGADPETLEEAALRVAGTLKRPGRAVTKADYEELARTTPGVAIARAHAAIGLHPLHPCVKTPGAVTVFIVPFAPRPDALGWTWPDRTLVAAPAVDPGALATVQAYLDARRLLTAEIFVRPTRYRAVSLRVDVAASPADAEEFASQLGGSLSRYLDPIAGGENGDGLPFGEPVRPSALLRVAQQALMQQTHVEQVLVGLDDQPPTEGCRDLPIGPYELAYLRSLRVVYRESTTTGGLP